MLKLAIYLNIFIKIIHITIQILRIFQKFFFQIIYRGTRQCLTEQQ